MTGANVLARPARPTTKSYRGATKKIVLRIQADHDLSDAELAERIGCSAGTVKNARTEATNLDGVTLASIEHEFGVGSIDPFYALGGARGVPRAGQSACPKNAPLELAEALHRLIATQHPSSDGGVETTKVELRAILPFLRDARGALDELIEQAA
ncbi:XRE family transcriptional regulator [Sphingomonas nostoxanthinifaciens]|uniref:XRE family transcriptional regulator n=1 Tax=Sphingomonas nostoxanthinifaciens TaxID=2872652 RepID=UPI001CC1E75D|nr:XRE family transcriptional regulator [Sphingomonas nostoxanthinifaciens]UAK24206.1 XRE family transcriptional regulator [Sphingomonas nostoxanthinifaciens]